MRSKVYKIKSKDELISLLDDELICLNKKFIIHYTCWCCDDELVTYEFDSDADIMANITEDGYRIGLQCVHCGAWTFYVDFDEIYLEVCGRNKDINI